MFLPSILPLILWVKPQILEFTFTSVIICTNYYSIILLIYFCVFLNESKGITSRYA
jgi:hypothetical protein